MEGQLIMTNKELERKLIISSYLDDTHTMQEIADLMQVSKRQARRIVSKYKKLGNKSLPHGNRGKSSNRARKKEIDLAIIERYKEIYKGFDPTLTAEKLEIIDGYKISREALRQLLIKNKLWHPSRERRKYRSRRERKECFGELLQFDGSIHKWFADKDEHQCLFNLVDDATGITVSYMATGETIEGAMITLRKWIELYGVPKSLYVDLKNVYVSPQELRKNDKEEKKDYWTHFSLACNKLGIKIIKAYSPQAKGRVERKHAVFQDRFVKELKLVKINDIDDANKLLAERFCAEINEKFAVSAKSAEDSHRKLAEGQNLDNIFCLCYERQVTNDWTISFEGQIYQIDKSANLYPKATINIKRHLDKNLSFWYNSKQINCEAIEKKKVTKQAISKPYLSVTRSVNAKKNKHKTPWSQFRGKAVAV